MSSIWPGYPRGTKALFFEFGRGGEAAVVVGQVGVCDEAVGGFDRRDPRQRQFEAVLEGAEQDIASLRGELTYARNEEQLRR